MTPHTAAAVVDRIMSGLGPVDELVQCSGSVLVKPDLAGDESHYSEISRHIVLVLEVIRRLRRTGVDVLVADSPFYSSESPLQRYHRTGLFSAAARLGARVLAPEEAPLVPISNHRRVFYLSEKIRDAASVFSFTRSRGHEHRATAGVILGLLTILPGYHKDLLLLAADGIRERAALAVDVCSHVRPVLAIYDACSLMNVRTASDHRAFVAASRDPVALDSYLELREGGSPLRRLAIRMAGDAGLGIDREEGIRLVGDLGLPAKHHPRLSTAALTDFVCRLKRRVLAQQAAVRVTVDSSRCMNCGECCNICPSGALSRSDQAQCPVADRDLCVACTACETTCRQNAVAVVPNRAMERLRELRRTSCVV